MNQTETVGHLKRRVDDLERVCAKLNARISSLAPEEGEVAGIRRKLLEHDIKIAKLVNGGVPELLAARTFSD